MSHCPQCKHEVVDEDDAAGVCFGCGGRNRRLYGMDPTPDFGLAVVGSLLFALAVGGWLLILEAVT